MYGEKSCAVAFHRGAAEISSALQILFPTFPIVEQISLTPFVQYNQRQTDVSEGLDGFSCISWSGLRQDTSLLIRASAREATQAALGGKEHACAVSAVVSRRPARQLGGGNVSYVFGKSWGKPFLAQINSSLLLLRQRASFLLCSQLCMCDCSCCPRFYRRPEFCGRRALPASGTGTWCGSPEQRLPSCELHRYIPSPPLLLVIRCANLLVRSPFMLLSVS